ncbi:MAG: UDP-N-acetylenolpyruvoylglucosamine reductase [Candidatus Cloacimonas sp. 4484_209]|nr:MAG: UDP-N-acetylenolpyruvoylglucosamine reductase [Candidatus Cloacimonas sp. 4484_209]
MTSTLKWAKICPPWRGSLQNELSGTVLWNEPMRRHTTFKIGGPADAIIIPSNETNLQHILKIASQNQIPVTVIGNGSNLLVSDSGIDGIIIKISGCFNNVTIQDRKIIAGAGCYLSRLTKLTADFGLSGLEFAAGIPGTVGGAVVTNAGTHEMEIGNFITKIRAMNYDGELIELSKEELKFGYRYTALQERDVIVLNVEMELLKGDRKEIKKKIKMHLERRKKKQPLNFHSAGSVFKNPPNDYAGRLIEACGCKGMRVGDAEVSKLHANFIVNCGNARANDVLKLMTKIRETVFQKYGIELEPEIKIIGRGIIWKKLG